MVPSLQASPAADAVEPEWINEDVEQPLKAVLEGGDGRADRAHARLDKRQCEDPSCCPGDIVRHEEDVVELDGPHDAARTGAGFKSAVRCDHLLAWRGNHLQQAQSEDDAESKFGALRYPQIPEERHGQHAGYQILKGAECTGADLLRALVDAVVLVGCGPEWVGFVPVGARWRALQGDRKAES